MIHSEDQLARALEDYAAELDRLAPSAQLHARMQTAIQHEVGQRPKQAQLRRWSGTVAASLVLAAATFMVLRQAPQPSLNARSTHPESAARPAASNAMLLPTGMVSLWPTQSTVFRVRSALNGPGPQQYEQQYWIDVRMANDGSMRIERILTADGAVLFALDSIEP